MPAPSIHKERAAELAAVLEGLPEPGIVHTRLRWAGSWEEFLRFFQDTSRGRKGPIRGWELTRQDGSPDGAPDWAETWELHHYRSLSDADESEYGFQDHLNAAARAFRTAKLTWGSIPLGLKIVVAEPRSFGGVLCHYARCEVVVLVPYDLV